jgi:hypothetical protein
MSTLSKVTIYFRNGIKHDITNLKIYWDSEMCQFRHMYYCDKCEEKIGCFCYDHLLDAISEIRAGSLCEKCETNVILRELYITDIIDMYLDEARKYQVQQYANNLITDLELESYDLSREEADLSDFIEILEDQNNEDLLTDYVISLLTDDEKHEEYMEACMDGECSGTACEI